jgi:Helix-turn-helix domain
MQLSLHLDDADALNSSTGLGWLVVCPDHSTAAVSRPTSGYRGAAFRFELDPNQAQRVLLAKGVGCSRLVYNWCLAESQRDYERTGKRPRLSELKARLVELKKSDAPWLYKQKESKRW